MSQKAEKTMQEVRAQEPKKKEAKTSKDVFSQSVVRESLKMLMEYFGCGAEPVAVEKLQGIADKLSDMAGKEPPWGWRYLRNFLNGKIEASERLARAIMALGATLDGTPVLVARAQMVQVLAVGKVKPGSVVLADSRPCARAGCRVEFVPRVPWQRYCGRECRRKDLPQRSQRTQSKGVNHGKDGD